MESLSGIAITQHLRVAMLYPDVSLPLNFQRKVQRCCFSEKVMNQRVEEINFMIML